MTTHLRTVLEKKAPIGNMSLVSENHCHEDFVAMKYERDEYLLRFYSF